MLAGEFRRQVTGRDIFGMDPERLRKVARALQRHPEAVAEGYNLVASDPTVRGRGGDEVGPIDVSFLVLAALAGGPIDERLGALSWHLYSAPSEDPQFDRDPQTRKRRMAMRCPVTGEAWAGRALRDILASPALAARVKFIMVFRHSREVSIHWLEPDRHSTFIHEADRKAYLAADKAPPEVTASMKGETLLWLAKATEGEHPIWKWRH